MMASSRHAPVATEIKNLECMRKAHRSFKSWHRRTLSCRTSDKRRDFGSVNFQIHQTVFQSHHHPQREAKTTSILELSVVKPTNVTNCPRQVHQPQHNHGQTDHGLKQINQFKVIGNIVARDIYKKCGTHQSTTTGGGNLNTKGSFTGDRWTQLIVLVNIMTHTTFTQSNLLASSAVVNPSFSSMIRRAGESARKANSLLRTDSEKN